MPDTTARGIQYPVSADQVTDLEDIFKNLADTADDAIDDALASLSPAFRALSNTAGFTHTSSGSWQTVTGWTGADGDPGDDVGITYASGVLTVSEAGIYFAQLTVVFNLDSDGTRGCRFLQTGNVAAGARAGWLGRVTGTESGTAWFLGALSAGDTLTMQAFQSGGASLALNIDESQFNRAMIVRLGSTGS